MGRPPEEPATDPQPQEAHPAPPLNAVCPVTGFLKKLREREGTTARCLEFTILTASRTSETTAATWSEFDLDAKVWTIPADRIKGEREHKVPLPDRAVEILRGMEGQHRKWVFSGNKGKHLTNGAMLVLLDRMGHGDVTVHGSAALPRLVGEETNYPREICELALAHVNGDETEAAYLRTDFFEKRRRLMGDWASYLLTEIASERREPSEAATQRKVSCDSLPTCRWERSCRPQAMSLG